MHFFFGSKRLMLPSFLGLKELRNIYSFPYQGIASEFGVRGYPTIKL